MTRLAIFDCDGTLIDSQAVICDAMERCFAEVARPAPGRDAIRRIVGLSLPQAMAVLLPEDDTATHDALADGYKRAFHALRQEGQVAEPMYDGLTPVLDALAADGWLLGIATGKSDRGLEIVLSGHGIGHRFVTRQTADRHPSKPDPAMVLAAMAEAGVEPEDTVMVGDTSYDMLMARAAGVRAIGVGWGYHPAGELRAAGADAVAMTPSDLLALIMVPAA